MLCERCAAAHIWKFWKSNRHHTCLMDAINPQQQCVTIVLARAVCFICKLINRWTFWFSYMKDYRPSMFGQLSLCWLKQNKKVIAILFINTLFSPLAYFVIVQLLSSSFAPLLLLLVLKEAFIQSDSAQCLLFSIVVSDVNSISMPCALECAVLQFWWIVLSCFVIYMWLVVLVGLLLSLS